MPQKQFINKLYMTLSLLMFSQTAIEAKKVLSLEEAQTVVISNSNEIKALESEVSAAKALIQQAGFRPNPELEFAMENGIGSEGASVNKMEIGVSQAFELGHKKDARIDVAQKNVKLAELAFNQVKRELESETIRRVIPIVDLKEQLQLIEEIITMTKNIYAVIKKRVELGAAMEIDLLGAEIELEELAIKREIIVREIENAKQNLTVQMGDKPIAFSDVSTVLSNDFNLPSLAVLEKKLLQHNDFTVNKMEQEVARAELQELKADAVTDLTIDVAYERNQEEEANAALIGVAVDLPFFNRNQGDIAEKKESITALQHQSKNTHQQLKQELVEQYNSFQSIVSQISSIKDRTLPRVEKMYLKVGELYKKSGVQIFDVIDTQIKLVETKMSIIELKTELAEIAADIYEITGYLSSIIKQ